jgi:hypothetical protein
VNRPHSPVEKNQVVKIESECRVPWPALGSPPLSNGSRQVLDSAEVGVLTREDRGPATQDMQLLFGRTQVKPIFKRDVNHARNLDD